MKLYSYLSKREPQLKDRLMYSAIKKSCIPHTLIEDAKQQIVLTWLEYEINTRNYNREQILSYASKLAYSSVLSVRRQLGWPVIVPKVAAKSCKVDPYTYESTEPDESMIEFHIDFDEDFDTKPQPKKIPVLLGDYDESVLNLVVEGESAEAIAEIKSRSLRWVKLKVEQIMQQCKTHETV